VTSTVLSAPCHDDLRLPRWRGRRRVCWLRGAGGGSARASATRRRSSLRGGRGRGRPCARRPAAEPLRVALPDLFPFARLSLAVDGLSGFFLVVISVVVAAAALYAPAYLAAHARHGHGAENENENGRNRGHRGEAIAAVLFDLFAVSMTLVVCAGDGLLFLLLWELMTLTSYFLVTFSTRKESAVRAGFIYVVMAHAGRRSSSSRSSSSTTGRGASTSRRCARPRRRSIPRSGASSSSRSSPASAPRRA